MSFKYVLRYGGKNPSLTRVLHYWFDLLEFPPPKNKSNWQALGGEFTLETKRVVTEFQMKYGLKPPNKVPYGEVRAQEWQQLGRIVGLKIWDNKTYKCITEGKDCPNPLEVIQFVNKIGGYTENAVNGGVNVYGPRFLSMYAEEFGGIDGSTIDGLGLFLSFMRTDGNITDIRHAAYLLATVYKESWYTWRPIDEKGLGAGKDYGKERIGKCGGKEFKNKYYGRGYIQITWEDNYQLADSKLNLGCALVANPERAKDPTIAYKIASFGMAEGWFEKKHNYKLSDFITGGVCDYNNARKIVNPYDSASFSEIEGYARTFEAILRASIIR